MPRGSYYRGLVYGVGYNNVEGAHSGNLFPDSLKEKQYRLWRNMLCRCYSKTYLSKHTSYVGCSVCKRWLTLSNFIDDLPLIENYSLWLNSKRGDRITLDKEYIDKSNRVYELSKVGFVTIKDSLREVSSRNHNRFSKESRVKQSHSIARPIICSNGKEYISSAHASRELNIPPSNISCCLTGKYKQTHGYIFKYKEENK